MAEDTRQDEAPASDPAHRPEPHGQDTPFQRFEDFVKKIAAVPKKEVDEKRAEYELERKKKNDYP
jgi:hypothetical protein